MSTVHANRLIEGRQAGGYTLPAEVLDAHATREVVKALRLPPPATLHPGDAGSALVDTAAKGEQPDIDAMVAALREVLAATAAHNTAAQAMAAANQVAADRLASAVAAQADVIIVEHLRPAYAKILERAAAAVADLGGRAPVAAQLLDAPAKVRTAFATLGDLRFRLSAVRQARNDAIAATGARPTLDAENLYADFQVPEHWTGGKAIRMAGFPSPTDPHEYMVWLVTDAAGAQPWLPTLVEQDDAYDAGPWGQGRRETAASARSNESVWVSS